MSGERYIKVRNRAREPAGPHHEAQPFMWRFQTAEPPKPSPTETLWWAFYWPPPNSARLPMQILLPRPHGLLLISGGRSAMAPDAAAAIADGAVGKVSTYLVMWFSSGGRMVKVPSKGTYLILDSTRGVRHSP